MIYQTGYVRYCQPDFIAPYEAHEYIPNDPYFGQQWYLHNTGQECNDGHFGTFDADIDAPEAWDISFGSADIVIAIVDEGVTDNHPDLPNTRQLRLSGSNFASSFDGSDPNDPSPQLNSAENHGNACAGFAAAELDNNEGVVGIAPHCQIMPVKVRFGQGLTFSDFADAITFAADNSAHVISCSWGAPTTDSNLDATIIAAIEDAIAQGSVVLFSAGNTANRIAGNDGFVGFPANANIPQLITVGASDRNDNQANYSPTSSRIDISAPSHTAYSTQIPGESFNMWTIDIPGQDGYNPWSSIGVPPPAFGEELPSSGTNHLSYTGRMGGTSASTPLVAGVVALMLSVNPCMSTDQIIEVLSITSEKVGGYDYAWNSSKPGHSQELGYGRVNAFLAVKAAQDLATPGMDLYTKDDPNDFGIEPNVTAEFLWVSEDIWVRNQQDGFTNQIHENPEYSPSDPVFVYVRVRNRGCEPSLGTEELKLYWAKAATALTWPNYWNGSITNPALMGDAIGVETIEVVEAGEQVIIEFEWFPPNPDDYENINEEPWHFCLLSRIVADNDPMNNELSSGTWNLGHNVKYNNNIAWKNLTIVNILPGIIGGSWPDDRLVGATVAIGNASDEAGRFDFEFSAPKNIYDESITELAEVRLTLDETTWQKWEDGGFKGANLRISREDRDQLLIEQPIARLENLTYLPHERSLLNVSFSMLTKQVSHEGAFDFHLVQKDALTQEVLGGEKYHITYPFREGFSANAGDDMEVPANETVQLIASDIFEDAIYNWYDQEGNLIHTGKEISVTSEINRKYKLEVIAEADGFKDYDEIEVRIKLGEIIMISPNPAFEDMTVTYNVQNASSAYLMLISTTTANVDNYFLDLEETTTTIDVSAYPFGIYTLALVVNGSVVDQKSLIIK